MSSRQGPSVSARCRGLDARALGPFRRRTTLRGVAAAVTARCEAVWLACVFSRVVSRPPGLGCAVGCLVTGWRPPRRSVGLWMPGGGAGRCGGPWGAGGGRAGLRRRWGPLGGGRVGRGWGGGGGGGDGVRGGGAGGAGAPGGRGGGGGGAGGGPVPGGGWAGGCGGG